MKILYIIGAVGGFIGAVGCETLGWRVLMLVCAFVNIAAAMDEE